MTISAKLKEIYTTAPIDQTYVETLTLSHSLFSKTWYICNDFTDWEFYDDFNVLRTFTPLPFIVKLPKQDTGGSNELDIALSNAGLDMMNELEAASANRKEPISCKYQVYLDTAQSKPQLTPPIRLNISDIRADIGNITATASRFDVLNRQFPKIVYNIDDFKGLDR